MTKRKLRIGMLAPPWVRVPPADYGGTETIVDLLARGYQTAGHEVTLWASGDSTCPVPRRHVIAEAQMPPDKYQEHLHLAAFMLEAGAGAYDLVHSHLEAIQPWADHLPCPVICTLHVDVTPERARFLAYNRAVRYVAISAAQARTFPIPARIIHNGLDIGRFPWRERKQEYLLFLGSLVPEKGLDVAVTASRRLGIPLRIAGYLPARGEDYLNRQLESDHAGLLMYLGCVSQADKLKLLAGARALLCPVRWDEPFGLVAIEAMACGTPVVALNRGALPEVVAHERTGFIADDESAFIDAVRHADRIDPAVCRRHCEEHFSSERMVNAYLEYFTSLS
jgi:glycosyltransferase involved in cell wall biosynthesis